MQQLTWTENGQCISHRRLVLSHDNSHVGCVTTLVSTCVVGSKGFKAGYDSDHQAPAASVTRNYTVTNVKRH